MTPPQSELILELSVSEASPTLNVRAISQLGPREGVTVLKLEATQAQIILSAISRMSLGYGGATAATSLDPVQDFGYQMYSMLFAGDFSAYYRQIAAAEADGSTTRILLAPHGTLSLYPWELVFDRSRNNFLALSPRTPLVRRVPATETRAQAWPDRQPLRLQPVQADVDGFADLEQERQYLRSFESEFKGRLEVLPPVKVTSVENLKDIQPCDILHFSGSGNFPAEFAARPTSETFTRVGYSSYVKFDELRSMIVERAGSPALLFLSSDYSSPAARELARISPLTVGLQGLISEESMLHFERAFYRALFTGDPFELAVVKGRLAMDMQHPGVRDWSLIVAYAQAADTHITWPPATLIFPGASTGIGALVVQPALSGANARQWRRLQRELDIHQANLAALEQKMSQPSNVPGGDFEGQRAELRKHIDRIESEIKKLAGN